MRENIMIFRARLAAFIFDSGLSFTMCVGLYSIREVSQFCRGSLDEYVGLSCVCVWVRLFLTVWWASRCHRAVQFGVC